MRPQTDPRYQPQFQPLASPSLPPADVVDFRGYFKVETFAHSAVIYRPGDTADKVYLLRSGRVRLIRQGKGKSRSVLSILKPGDLFGEVLRPEGALIEELAVSSGKSEVWSIEGRDFRAQLEARPALAVDVIRASTSASASCGSACWGSPSRKFRRGWRRCCSPWPRPTASARSRE